MRVICKLNCLLVCFLYIQYSCEAQHILFAENFENNTLSSMWQKVSGNWHIAAVDDMRIAPAENGYRYTLCSGGPGFINLIVDIPDSIKTGSMQLQFAYYTYSKGPGMTIETEFHRKDLKDGIKGKPWKANLPVKGRWFVFKKTFKIPAGADAVYLTFYESKTGIKTTKTICLDAITITALR